MDYTLQLKLSEFSFPVHRNPQNAIDVNADGKGTPIDALIVINSLNEDGPRTLDVALDAPLNRVSWADVTGAEDIDRGRRLDRLDEHFHLPAADQAGVLGEVVVEVVLDGGLALAGVRYDKWIRFMLPLMALLAVASLVMLGIAAAVE